MTVASEISRLQCAKANIKTAIEGKGVTVGSSIKLDEYAACIGEIQQGATEGILPITAPTLSGVAEHGKNCLCWNDPDDDSCRGTQLTCWTGTSLVRKIGGDPQDVSDGTVVITNITRDQYCNTYFVDTGLQNGCTYHYRTFANVSVGKTNYSPVLCLTPTKGFDVDFLLIAGGGGGGGGSGSNAGGGGGAGGVIYCTKYQIGNIDTASITIGNGGNGGYASANGSSGGNSTFCSSLFNIISCGGGGGGRPRGNGSGGGSGGGAGGGSSGCVGGTASQGNRGGSHTNNNENSSGGGGFCGAGGDSGSNAGCGGLGVSYDISGTSVGYAGGGGGAGAGGYGCYYGCGGKCGGGGGGNCGSNGGNATGCGSGGGGGAGGYYSCTSGGRGGNGIFIMRYNKNCGYDITGGCKYTCGDYTIHCFTSSGTLTFN